MSSLTWMFVIVIFCGALAADPPNVTSCEEFERGARFSPYDVIISMWKIFYFWADNTELHPIVFSLPAKNRLHKFKELINAIDPDLEVEWQKATLFMNPRLGTEVLFLYQGTPGAFRALIKIEQRNKKVRPYPVPLIKFADIRMKIVGNYLGMMCCEDLSAYALARMENIPTTESECIKAASTLGYTGVEGRSHLYLTRKLDEL